MGVFKFLMRAATALLGAATVVAWVAPAQAAPVRIENTASLSFTTGGDSESVASNTTLFSFDRGRTVTVLKYYRMPTGFDYSDLTCVTTPVKGVHGAPISAEQLASMKEDDSVTDHSLGIVLWNTAGNKDPFTRETETVLGQASTGQSGSLILTETGPDTGVFAGGFSSTAPSGHAQSCLPVFPAGTTFNINYIGDGDSEPSNDSILIDPFGHVFDSKTGAKVDGVEVTIINADTGLPAKVYGDDGVTPYPSTVISGQDVTDASGRVYDYEAGDYRFPFVEPGHYQLRVRSGQVGYASPSLVAPADLPAGPDGPYVVSDASYEKVFDLLTPDPLEVNIPVDPLAHGVLLLQKTTNVREAEPGDVIPYHLQVGNPDGGLLREAVLNDTLPQGVKYRKGSTHGIAEPDVSADGRTLTFWLPDMAPAESLDITYAVDVLPQAPVGDAVNRAVVWIPGSPASPEATASVHIKSLLFTDAMTIVGRVVTGGCDNPKTAKGVSGIRILLDDGTYVTSDRDGLYHFEGLSKGRHVVQLDTGSLTSAYEPMVCRDDTRWAGSATSRFVEGDGGSLKRVDFVLRATGKEAEKTEEKLPITVLPGDVAAGGHTDWLLGQKPGIDWLFPQIDHNPRSPAVRVVIKHAPGQRIALTVNGEKTDPLAFDGTDKSGSNVETDVAVSIWTGLPLKEGDNTLEARVLDADGHLVKTLTRTVHYANTPLVATYVPELSRLIADGKTRPLIAVRLTDRDGKPVRDGAMAAFRLEAPYVAAQVADMDQARQLAGLDRSETFARVSGDDGVAFIALQPTTQPGQVRLSFNLTQDKTTRKSDLKAWLAAGAQDWVVVGFAAGTVGFDTLAKNTHRYWMPKDRDVKSSGEVSLYAKGRIKGSWLMTIAYNSNRSYDPTTGLLSGIDPDRYYTVYGDGTRQAYDASTSGKLYLRLERKDAYVMLGDFESGLTETQLTRFNRTFNGLKMGYNGKRLSATAFTARSNQRFARDEIQGNGLSGPYRLTAGGLVANTDKVTIETRDRLRPEKILDSKPMTRHLDYDIDPDAGTIVFRSPVLSRDSQLNPVFIVVDYEVAGLGDKRQVSGGRVAAKLLNDRVEVGASALQDGSQQASVAGIDVKAKLSDTTELRVEAAAGGSKNAGANGAYLVEVEHHGAKTDLLAYDHKQEVGFGVGQQSITETGTHKAGIDLQQRLTETLTLTTSLWKQEYLTRPQTRTAGDVKLEYSRSETSKLFAEVTTATDEGGAGSLQPGTHSSQLLTFGGSQAFLDKKLLLNGQVQLALGGSADNLEFPVRQQLGAAYAFSETVRFVTAYETAKGSGFDAHTLRAGFELKPWNGAKLSSTLNQLALGENGMRTFAQFGLEQSLKVGKRWTVDASVDASSTLNGDIKADAVNPFQPISAGTTLNDGNANEDYSAWTLGATYRADNWSWNGRLEARHAQSFTRKGLTSNWVRSLGEGKTLASGIRLYDVRDIQGRKAQLGSADASMAWRPLDSHWSVLERLELRHQRADANVTGGSALGLVALAGDNQVTTRLINNVAVNYRSDLRDGYGIEASVYYGAKYVQGKLADDKYDGFIDAIGVDVRKSMGKRFDLAFSLSQQMAHSSGIKALSYGPSVGISPKTNVWISIGYNLSGYHDPDSDGSRYTAQGAYVTVRVKFDQSTLAGLRGGSK